MMRSLRSRLIVGMLLGMTVLLIAAGTTIYMVLRQHLYQAFDETLLGSASSLTLLVHPGPFGSWFDTEGLARLPAGQIREGALFQLWSDQPIDIPAWRPGSDAEPDDASPPGRWPDDVPPRMERPSPNERAGPDAWPPPETRPRAEPLPGLRPPRRPRGPSEPWRRRASSKLVIRSASLGESDLPRLDTVPGQPRFERITLPDGRPGRAIGVQFRAPRPPPGLRRTQPANLTAVVAASTVELEQQLSFLGALLAATALGTMAVAGGVAWLVVSRGLRPLATVARAIAAMGETDLKRRIANRGAPREIEPVVSQLNGLLGRLDEAFDRERALTADVAHELRTPVAEIRAIAEVTLNRPRDAQEYREALGEMLEATRALQGLIEKLLVLARLETGHVKPELQPVALQPLLGQCWAQVRNHAERRGVTFKAGCPPDAVVSTDPKLLEVVLSNVLSNAATYTPDGGRITAEAQRVGAHCRLSVANTGCELNDNEIAEVFSRFWRADAARGRSGLNCGLGLTLVRRAMQAVGGEAEACITKERCFVLTLTFQATQDPAEEAPLPDPEQP